MKKKSNKKNKASFLYSSSLIFDENIDKLWLFLRDLCFETSIIDHLDNFKYIKGDNTWTIGNRFSAYWVGVSTIEAKCKSIKVDRMKKIIRWKFKIDIGIDYYKQLTLYRITNNNKTLVITSLYIIDEKNNLIDARQSSKNYMNLNLGILIKQSKYLQNDKKVLISFGSVIVDKNYLRVWNNLNNLRKLNELTIHVGENMQFKGQINKVGSFIKFYDENCKQIVFLKVISYDTPENKNQWLMRFETIGINYHNCPKKTEIKIVKINEYKTQVSFMHQFAYDTNSNFIKEFNIKKKETIKKIKEYIENNDKEFIIPPCNEIIIDDSKDSN